MVPLRIPTIRKLRNFPELPSPPERKVVEEEIEDEESEEEAATGEEKETFRNQMIAAVIIKIHFELSVFYASYHLKCRNVSPVYMIYFDHMYQSMYFL